jgi:hypothetical protein
MSQPFKLYRLQKTDSQLDQAHNRLLEIEIALNENESLRRAQKTFNQAAADLEDARKDLRIAEENVRTQRIKIEQSESALYGGKVTNPKELQDIQQEVGSLKRYLEVLEDRQLNEMIAVEDAEDFHNNAVKDLEDEKAATRDQNVMLLEEKTRIENDIRRLESEREATSSSIEADDLRLYEELRIQRNGIAVTKVSDRTCGACGSTLSASLLQATRSPNRITRCESCGRILYGG